MKLTIGLDFGTQSARGVLVDAENGGIIKTAVAEYAHAIPDDCLVDGADYDAALEALLEELGRSREIAGIGIDATALTLVPVAADGRLLSMHMPDAPQAKVKLWKRHTAQKYADMALEKAKEYGEKFLENTGSTVSSEWTIPKLIETREEAPDVWGNMDIALDLCDYLTWRLTGNITRSAASMCYKSCWTYEHGFPSDCYLDALAAGFADEYKYLMRGDILPPGACAGYLTKEWRDKLGITENVVVAAGQPDGNTPPVAMGAVHDGDVSLTVGTSMVMLVNTSRTVSMRGLIGAAPGGIVPGLTALECGQNCTGELLGWYVENMLPAAYAKEAEEKGISPHELLSEKVREPWSNKITACNWLSGSRCAPADLSLTGAFTGLTLASKPEDIYLALVQSLAVNTREMLDMCRENGADIRHIFAAGGVARKSPLLMQQFADITGMEIYVTDSDEASAFGSAVLAAAAGVYGDIAAACARMCGCGVTVYKPDAGHRDDYEALYARSHGIRLKMAGLQHN